MRDLEDDLRADAAAWREQVDGLRPEPVLRRTRSRAWIGALVAAALVVALAVVVALRIGNSPGAHIAAGADRSTPTQRVLGPPIRVRTLPYFHRVPQQATCPTGSSGSGFAVSLPAGDKGSRTLAAAAAKYPPKNVHWMVARVNGRSALLLYRAYYLHAVRMPGGGWAVDSGGHCGGGTATVTR